MSVSIRFCLMAVIVLSMSVSAPTQDRTRDQLATVTALQCVFRLVANGSWRNGAPYVDVKQTELRMTFTTINADEGTATITGLFGRSQIVAQLSRSLHFIQSFRDGPLYVTTVFGTGPPSQKLMAVHTRHEYSGTAVPGFTSSPEQYYGDCEVVP